MEYIRYKLSVHILCILLYVLQYNTILMKARMVLVKEFVLPNLDNERSMLKTIRMKNSTLQKLEELSIKNNISVNRLINECIEFALENLSVEHNNEK